VCVDLVENAVEVAGQTLGVSQLGHEPMTEQADGRGRAVLSLRCEQTSGGELPAAANGSA
jgi:hypothetical protein